MKNLILAAAALCLAVPLAAQGPGRMGPPAGPPTMDEITARLKLTPAQQAEIAPLHAAHLKEVAPFRATVQAEMGAARSARQSGAPAESAAVHQAKARTAMEELRARGAKWQEQLAAKLTAEQKAEWTRWEDERRQEMRARMRGRDSSRPGGPPN